MTNELRDTISSVSISEGEIKIRVADGSVMQFSLDKLDCSRMEKEIPALVGAEIVEFVNERENGFFKLKYAPKSNPNQHRHISFFYDLPK